MLTVDEETKDCGACVCVSRASVGAGESVAILNIVKMSLSIQGREPCVCVSVLSSLSIQGREHSVRLCLCVCVCVCVCVVCVCVCCLF